MNPLNCSIENRTPLQQLRLGKVLRSQSSTKTNRCFVVYPRQLMLHFSEQLQDSDLYAIADERPNDPIVMIGLDEL